MPDGLTLQDHPGLATWYRAHSATPPGVDQPAQLLVWRLCEAMCTGPTSSVRRLVDGLRVFMTTSSAPLQDFLQAEDVCHGCDAKLLELIGGLGEAAVRSEYADSFLQAMQSLADATGLVVLRFLAAWAALNIGRLEQCIAECEKVDEPFAAIFTVQGQALLELGKPRDALEVLAIAVKLAPQEVLAWFQAAKAHHLIDEYDQAFDALRRCRALSPHSDEVCLYMGLVALDPNASPSYTGEALTALKPLMARFADHPVIVFTLVRLACRHGDKEQAEQVINAIAWQNNMRGTESVRQLPPVLRALNTTGWMDLAANLLNAMMPQKLAG
ncbi:MAG: hypothetical protein NTZ90_02815 [Proteobacteria bacterium]|nr:hypothetical protein [Pseudomonadota bacterium]